MLSDLIKRLSRNDFIKGGILFTSISFLVSICNYIFNLILARGFSLSIYGEYMTALSYFAVLTVPFSALNIIVLNKLSKTKVENRATLAMSIEKYILSSILKFKWHILFILTAISILFYFKTNLSSLTIGFILSSLFLNVYSIFYSATIQAYKKFLIAGLFPLSIAIFKIVSGFFIINSYPTLLSLYLFLILVNIFTIYIGSRLLRYKQKINKNLIKLKSPQSYIRSKQIVLSTISMLGIIGMLNMDLIFVKKFFDSDQAGLYAAISLMGKIILYATGPLSLVAVTFFSGSENKQNRNKILLFTALLYVLVGIVASIVYWLFSNLVVSLIFGSKFLVISQYIWLSAIFGTLYSLVNLFAQFGISKLRTFASFSVLGLILQVIGLYFIHRSFYDVLIINISIMILMVIIYSVSIHKDEK